MPFLMTNVKVGKNSEIVYLINCGWIKIVKGRVAFATRILTHPNVSVVKRSPLQIGILFLYENRILRVN